MCRLNRFLSFALIAWIAVSAAVSRFSSSERLTVSSGTNSSEYSDKLLRSVLIETLYFSDNPSRNGVVLFT